MGFGASHLRVSCSGLTLSTARQRHVETSATTHCRGSGFQTSQYGLFEIQVKNSVLKGIVNSVFFVINKTKMVSTVKWVSAINSFLD